MPYAQGQAVLASATKGPPNYFINLLREFNYNFFSPSLSLFLFLARLFIPQMDKMSAYFLEIINKTITVGITDDLFSDSEKAQIIDDYNEWINKNNDEMATGYVICTCFMRFGCYSISLPLSCWFRLPARALGLYVDHHRRQIRAHREYISRKNDRIK